MNPAKTFAVVALALAAVQLAPAHASVQVTDGAFSYAQNFDTLAQSGSANSWLNDSTLSGWSLFRQPAPGSAITAYAANDGSSNTGGFVSYGATASADRALGGLGSGSAYFGSPASGAVAGWIAASFSNVSAKQLNGFSVSFDGEQWRNGGNTAAQSMVFEYGFGSSFSTVTTWVAPGGNFNWSSPVASATAAAVDGNGAGRVAGRGGSVSGLSWNPGDTLWVRWTEKNDVGNDHGLAIDNFAMSVSAVPEPAGYGMFLAGLGLVALARRKR